MRHNGSMGSVQQQLDHRHRVVQHDLARRRVAVASDRGSYAWRVAYVYRPIGSNNWYELGWNWSNSCYLN